MKSDVKWCCRKCQSYIHAFFFLVHIVYQVARFLLEEVSFYLWLALVVWFIIVQKMERSSVE